MKKTMKRLASMLLAILMVASLCSCGGEAVTSSTPAGSGDETAAGDKPKIALIVNQRSGDSGPIDSMFAGADKAEQELGVEIKRLESEDPAAYEDDLRAMAKAGYELIISTFPPMEEAAKVVAKEYPDVKFAGVFQYVNAGEDKLDNYWSSEFVGGECLYVLGTMAGKLTKSNVIGYVGGSESESVYDAANAYMRGAKAANPDVKVEFMVVDSYEDPAKAKEIASAMIERGVDVLQTDCGNSQVGVIEAASENNVYVSGDVADNFDLCPTGFFSSMSINFGANIYMAVEDFLNDEFPGGTHSQMNLQTGAYFVPFDILDKLEEANPDKAEAIDVARKAGEEAIEKINSGEIVVEYDDVRPDWERIQNEQ